MRFLNQKGKKLIVTATLASLMFSPLYSFAYPSQASSDTQSQVQQAASTLIGGKIQPYTQYSIRNQNGYLVAQGETNAKGYFIEDVADVSIGDSITLEYGSRRISQAISSRVVLFTETNNNTMLLQSPMLGSMDAGDAAFSIGSIAIMAATGDYLFAAIGFVSFLIGLFGPSQEDIITKFTEQSLQELTENVTAQIDTDNQKMIANFTNAQKYRVDKDFTDLMGVSKKLSNYTNLLDNTVFMMDDFKNSSEGSKYKNAYQQLQQGGRPNIDYWDLYADISNYEDANGITTADKTSVRKVMVKYIANSFDYEDDFNFEDILTRFRSLNKKLSVLQSELNPYKPDIASILTDMGVTGTYNYDVCDGSVMSLTEAAIKLTKLNLDQLYMLKRVNLAYNHASAKQIANLDTEYANALVELRSLVAVSSSCRYFFNQDATAWGSVSYMTFLGSRPGVVYKIKIDNLNRAEDFKENIDDLVFDPEVRKKYLTPSQNAFFNRFLEDTDTGPAIYALDQDDKNVHLINEDTGGGNAVYLEGYFYVNHGTDLGREDIVLKDDRKDTSIKYISYDGFFKGTIDVAVSLPKGAHASNYYIKNSQDGRAYQLSEAQDGIAHVTIDVDASAKSFNKFNDVVSISLRDMDNNQIDSKEIFIGVPTTAKDETASNFGIGLVDKDELDFKWNQNLSGINFTDNYLFMAHNENILQTREFHYFDNFSYFYGEISAYSIGGLTAYNRAGVIFNSPYMLQKIIYDCSDYHTCYHVGSWESPSMIYSLAMPDYKVFDLKVTSSGADMAQVIFNPGPQVDPEQVNVTVNDEANRNCSIKGYDNGQFIELGKGNTTVSYMPNSMVWNGTHMLVGYYCNNSFDGIEGNVTFTVDVPSVGQKSITEMVRDQKAFYGLKVTSSGGDVAQVVFNPGPQVSPEEVSITVNDDANRNCSIKAYNNNQFVELGEGNTIVSYIPDSMVWNGKHMLVGYYCDQSFDGIDGNVTFTVDVPGVGQKSITEMVRDQKAFGLDVKTIPSKGGMFSAQDIAEVVFHPSPKMSVQDVNITVNDEANRNCSIRAYKSNQYIELGRGNATFSYMPDTMIWNGQSVLVGYYCDDILDATQGNVTFSVGLPNSNVDPVTISAIVKTD
ncbi:hypothetical protein IB680_07310 [Francisella philomiragia]|uniref:hypothetical protein n=1 Tax=Francisella philomiragia TaxID=28110 RepID=UPI000B58842C|nr:hypothetical protein [Francisella philomiragia]MBK2095483.1 hypothetical protein [Francisella philomiragia]